MKKEELKKTRQFKEFIKRGADKCLFSNVPYTWLVKYDLSPTDLLAYCTIRDMSLVGAMNVYSGSIKGLCARLNVSMPTARKSLETLQLKGFICREKTFKDGRMLTCYRALSLSHNVGESMQDALNQNIALMEARGLIKNGKIIAK